MSHFYFIALIGSRLIGVLAALILSHTMTSHDFGQFSLINTNALAIQMIAGSWLVSIANRSMVSTEGTINRTMMSAIMMAMVIISNAVLAAGIGYSVIHPEQSWIILATAALALSFIIYEMVLALNNALGHEAAYASFATYRNILALALGLGLVLIGVGPLGPVFGLLISTSICLALLPGARRIWSGARPSWNALSLLRPHLGHGLAGACALGIYILVNAPSRNIFAQQFGADISGIWTLCSDLSYGPLAVIGNAYGLSQIRLIYISAAAADATSLMRRARSLIETSLTLIVPYSIGAVLFAQDAVRLMLAQAQVDMAVKIVIPATLQGCALLILYCLTSVMLARRRFWLVGLMVLTVAVAATIGAWVGTGIVDSSQLAMAGSAGAVGLWLIWGISNGVFHVRWRELVKLSFASAAMWASATGTMAALDFLEAGRTMWIVAAGVSVLAFAGTAIWLRLSGFTDMLPPVVQRHFPHLANQIDDD